MEILMVTFKQWHDEDLTFNNEMKIYFCQCDLKSNLILTELLRITTDSAVDDYNQRGMSYKFLQEHDMAVLVSRVAFTIHKMPVANELITIRTWEEKPEPLQLMRAYEITDRDGSKLVSGLSAWLVVHYQSHKIIRTKDFTLRPEPNRSEMHDCPYPGKIVVTEELRPLGEHSIGNSDIDANGHVNSSRYGAFAIDALPETYLQKEIKGFRLNYSKEAKKGSNLSLYGAFNDTSNKVTVVGKQAGSICFESEFLF